MHSERHWTLWCPWTGNARDRMCPLPRGRRGQVTTHGMGPAFWGDAMLWVMPSLHTVECATSQQTLCILFMLQRWVSDPGTLP